MTDPRIEFFESNFLDWVRSVSIFSILGLALYSFTEFGKQFAMYSFVIAAILIATSLYDYVTRRKELTDDGVSIKITLDILAASMLAFFFLAIWVIFTVLGQESADDFTIFAHSQREQAALEAYKQQYEALTGDS